ncbi:MAG: hypothetical protein HYU64_03140 [Armatimonadetes bacterium]|nr:hypothetical protein [Armatimonadota bacterium]
MIRFHKNGVTLVEDKDGMIHILEPKETLREVAKYIWDQPSLEEYRIENTDEWAAQKETKMVQLRKEPIQRLRIADQLMEDPFFQEP